MAGREGEGDWGVGGGVVGGAADIGAMSVARGEVGSVGGTAP